MKAKMLFEEEKMDDRTLGSGMDDDSLCDEFINLFSNIQNEYCDNAEHLRHATKWLPKYGTYECPFCKKPIKLKKAGGK
jgi:hypothetical protein